MNAMPLRRFPVGAEILPDGGVHFRLWAPRHSSVAVVLESGPGAPRDIPMEPQADGYHAVLVPQACAGLRYRFRLGGQDTFPDPVSRFQPDGPHGPSQVVDPAAFPWRDALWPGVGIEGQVIYEMHIGTFTQEGDWDAARRELAELAACGVTVIELMPVADFPGRFGWGYDGVGLFAPVALYGEPDDMRRFVDEAHARGLGVILDVVYNHLGPSGNYLGQFSEAYFTDKYANEWGQALNFDGPHSGPVREFFLANAAFWIAEHHLDGLRLDATQQIFDDSPEYIVTAIARQVRQAAGGRKTILVAENEPQDANLARPAADGGNGLDGLWNDDFHHAATVALTGRREAYYSDYAGTAQELLSMLKYGYLYQGQHYGWQKQRRGTPCLDLPPARFVLYLQNHDQIANSGRGERLAFLTCPGRLRAMTALLLLAPGTPMLFQGQEFGASAPFHFFSDHEPELAGLVRKGRAMFLRQFPSLATREMRAYAPDPGDPAVFARCKLDLRERLSHRPIYDLHKDLLRLRRDDAVFGVQKRGGLDGSALAEDCLLLRFFGQGGDDRLLLVNLGRDLRLTSVPEPLLAPPAGQAWRLLWSSENPRYGGTGTPPLEGKDGWRIPGQTAVALGPVPKEKPSHA
ncbi:MAG: malto-oligosyltrehalose trehalohydrolase [Solidesulfovibrio magneticus str. Maddingley MBC34]|uniref:Malto-oligosyltrehalose trehalohydrolase n=1 Tax=Solidesulfovibrio magneticus str. Maddingley MBC34 TaxID=1206767 RepID=K6GLF8_9BACT|nr:MAG: malto-oligosyltrehalose trehalohydrolase [Solidesulfovibrio magneticus str. Maddingley MBC34]